MSEIVWRNMQCDERGPVLRHRTNSGNFSLEAFPYRDNEASFFNF